MIDKRELLNNEDIEIYLFIESIYLKYNIDFRMYSWQHIRRRTEHIKNVFSFDTISQMTRQLLYDKDFITVVLPKLSINVTSMFRDPEFFYTLRKNIIPKLSNSNHIKIWNAGCSTGEEVYSTAILLKEEQLLYKTQIYGTDFNDIVVKKAKAGKYNFEDIIQYTQNYQKSGGIYSFSDYYTVDNDSVSMVNSLKKHMVFSTHNLVCDHSFAQMDLIMCRNVLIYFNKELQNKVLQLFSDSLSKGGYLCLGSKESIKLSNCSKDFIPVDASLGIYQRN